MKKAAIIVTSVLMLLAFSACGDSAPTSNEITETETTNEDKPVVATAIKDDSNGKIIDKDGEYTLTGEINGQVLVTAENVTLILDGVTITCADDSAILGKDGTSITQNLTVQLNGHNVINGGKHGIQGKDNLIITGAGTANITAVKDGLHAGDSLTVEGGNINVLASYEGFEAPSILISGGVSTIHATDDGVNAAVDDGDTTVPIIKITGGETIVYCFSDAIDSNGTLDITGGTVLLFVGETRDGETIDTDRGATLTPALFGTGSINAGATLAVNDRSFTVEENAVKYALIIPDLIDGQSYAVTVDGADFATITASSAVQGGMPTGFGGRGGGTRADKGFPADGSFTPSEGGGFTKPGKPA
ncbi:MAG: carbohydrate-binding domain-containing protein [Oscillospiraceae bacterium]|jgi:hypothetical protein|nr:carbohydrate-binding domain-containing protein [Oscillospiraceae bacterium]